MQSLPSAVTIWLGGEQAALKARRSNLSALDDAGRAMSIDLIARATANATQRRADADATCAADDTGTLTQFRVTMATSAMGNTVDADKLLTYADDQQIVSARAAVLAKAHGDVQEAERLLRVRAVDQDGVDWFQRRAAFEDHWKVGHDFVYWVVITEGPGLAALPDRRYGDFCLVIPDPNRPVAESLGVFPGNTAELYAEAGVLDVQRCEADATSWADRADLLTVKHVSDVAATHETQWGALICRAEDFTEVVRAGHLPLTSVTEVRMVAERKAQLEGLWTDLQTDPDSVPDSERPAVKAYAILNTWRRNFGLRILGV